jgi:acyl homoserine lactone synthase
MLRYLRASELAAHPRLASTMFRDRATQFRHRLGWDVAVSPEGEERDAYDALNPLYVIWQDAAGRHGGSMRFLPTTGRTMLREHFADLPGAGIACPRIWECTRFCLADGAGPQVSAALMLGGAELGLALGLTHALGVFDARMLRIYSRLGWPPQVLGGRGIGADAVRLGRWAFSESVRDALAARAGIAPELSACWAAPLARARVAA